MTIPAGYNLDNNGFYYKASDGSGPYSIDQDGNITLCAGLQISATQAGFSRGLNGFWHGTSGDGPYASDGIAIYQLAL